MSNLDTANAPLAESTKQSPSFEVPQYHITLGKDGDLEWTPPVGSPELAIALSYHFPQQKNLSLQMTAARLRFFDDFKVQSEQARSSLASPPIGKSTSEVKVREMSRVAQVYDVIPAPRGLPESRRRVRLPYTAKPREPILYLSPRLPEKSEIIWKADTGEEVELTPKKRQYTERERIEVGNNRGNVCKEHRQKKQKCSPFTCSQNKEFLRNNSGTQDRTHQKPNITEEGSQGNSNELERHCSNNHGNCIQSNPPNEIPEKQNQPVMLNPIGDTSYINGLSVIPSGNASLNSTDVEPTEDANIFSGRKRTPYIVRERESATEFEKASQGTLSLLSPAVSTYAAKSPTSVKSPPVSFFDDAWVDSPYRVDDEQVSDSECEAENLDFNRREDLHRREVNVGPSPENLIPRKGVNMCKISSGSARAIPEQLSAGPLRRSYDKSYEQRTTITRHDSGITLEKVNPETRIKFRRNTMGKSRRRQSIYLEREPYAEEWKACKKGEGDSSAKTLLPPKICERINDDAAVDDGMQNLSVLLGATSLESTNARN